MGPNYGDEWPDRYRVPDQLVDSGATDELGGLRITVREVGRAESDADCYLLVEAGERAVAFIGDLAFGGTHSYLSDGHSGDRLAALELLGTDLAGLALYPGHGPVGDAGPLLDQRKYLLMYREVVERVASGASQLDEAGKAELTERMSAFLPGAALDWLVALGADPVAAELAELS
ncbi:hypothetical protein [Nocardia rhizosphaerae]|uniref:Metallo-beta-lactamase superfamily protein n=1 Tax=Nocardia rhizosphaerae TaxID=1691571 RepID=A0ABV8L189_9NOCA